MVEKGTGAPVAGARVRVEGNDSDEDVRGTSTMSDADGNFRLTGLSPARYKPGASSPGKYGQAAESVLLGLGQTVDGIVIEVHPAAVIKGRVLLPDGKSPCPSGWVSLGTA